MGGRLRLYVKPVRRGGKHGVGVFVMDNGGGIKPEVRSRIFEPFFTTKGQKGTGLGLWVARDLVLKHAGFIQVRSSVCPGRTGSCFFVFFPSTASKVRR
jgi:signal transduction histidine kinase